MTCNECKYCATCIMSAPDGHWQACEDFDEVDEAEPIRHGKWEDVNGDGSLWRCSVCGETQCCDSNYCGDCGAKMDLTDHYCDRNKCLQMEYNGKGCAECEVTE